MRTYTVGCSRAEDKDPEYEADNSTDECDESKDLQSKMSVTSQ